MTALWVTGGRAIYRPIESIGLSHDCVMGYRMSSRWDCACRLGLWAMLYALGVH